MFRERVCVIGAGVGGIAICKYLKENSIPFDCFEKSDSIGGIWNIQNENTSAYDSLHINTSKKITEFEDFKMPNDYPDFPSHFLIFKYLENYCKHFDVLKNISFKTSVQQVEYNEENQFIVTLSEGLKRVYSHVIVATGHHWLPNIPIDINDSFKGEFLHSKFYKNSITFQNKKILIIGIGNSAVDIACELARVPTNQVTISTRNSTYIYPHYFLGKPLCELSSDSKIQFPKFFKRQIGHLLLRIATGNQQKIGIPKPSFKLLNQHSTVSTDIFSLIGKGKINFRSDIESINERSVKFSDGNKDEFDTIIACTGYKISLPFLSNQFKDNQTLEVENKLDLYKRIVHPQYSNLLFVGFVQPNYSVFRTVEEQSKWIINLLKKNFKLPSIENMNQEMNEYSKELTNDFYQSKRHTIQVDYFKYINGLKKDYQ